MGNEDLKKIFNKYDYCGDFYEGLAWVEVNGKWGFIDKTGKEVIHCMYEACGDFSEGLAKAKLNGKWGYIDKIGKMVIPFKYDNCGYFYKGLARAKLNGKWVCIDKTGREYTDQAVYFNETSIVDDEILVDDEKLKKFKEEIIAIAKARVGAVNGEEENFEEKFSAIIEETNKIIKNIMAQKAEYDKKLSQNKTKGIEEIKSKVFDALDALLVDNKGVTHN